MKKIYLLIAALAICTTSFAQNFLGMKIKKFGVTMSHDEDRVKGLDAAYFTNLSKTPFKADIAAHEFPENTITSMTCENPAVRLDITVLPFTSQPNLQLNMGTSLMMNRIDATGYGFWENDYYGASYGDRNYSDIEFSSYSNEVALDASMVWHQKLAFLHFYGGAGSNLGYTFAGNMDVNGSYTNDESMVGVGIDGASVENMETVYFHENHNMKNSLHQRVFLQGGVSIIFLKRLELGFEARRGVGYRYNTGNPAKFTNLLSAGFNLRWNLK